MVGSSLERQSRISKAVQAGLYAVENAWSFFEHIEGGSESFGHVTERVLRRGREFIIASGDPLRRSALLTVRRDGSIRGYAQAKSPDGGKIKIPVSGPVDSTTEGSQVAELIQMGLDRATQIEPEDLR